MSLLKNGERCKKPFTGQAKEMFLRAFGKMKRKGYDTLDGKKEERLSLMDTKERRTGVAGGYDIVYKGRHPDSGAVFVDVTSTRTGEKIVEDAALPLDEEAYLAHRRFSADMGQGDVRPVMTKDGYEALKKDDGPLFNRIQWIRIVPHSETHVEMEEGDRIRIPSHPLLPTGITVTVGEFALQSMASRILEALEKMR